VARGAELLGPAAELSAARSTEAGTSAELSAARSTEAGTSTELSAARSTDAGTSTEVSAARGTEAGTSAELSAARKTEAGTSAVRVGRLDAAAASGDSASTRCCPSIEEQAKDAFREQALHIGFHTSGRFLRG